MDNQMIDHALNQYFKKQALYDVGEKKLGEWFGTPGLQEQELRLSIMQKRKELGLPLNDDMYEKVLNDEDVGFLEKKGVQAAFGGMAGKALYDSYNRSMASNAGNFVDTVTGQLGKGSHSSLRGLLTGLGGMRYGTPVRSAGRLAKRFFWGA